MIQAGTVQIYFPNSQFLKVSTGVIETKRIKG